MADFHFVERPQGGYRVFDEHGFDYFGVVRKMPRTGSWHARDDRAEMGRDFPTRALAAQWLWQRRYYGASRRKRR